MRTTTTFLCHLAAIVSTGLLSLAVSGGPAQAEAPVIETMAQAINRAQGFQYGESGDALEYIRAEVARIQQKPEARNELANVLAALLDAPGSSDAFRLFVCQQLYLIGGEEQIDELLPLLLNPRFSHAARYALEAIPSARADEALWTAIEEVDGPVAAGLVTSLARRQGPDIARRLAQLLDHRHETVVIAALIGLGQLGSAEAEGALKQARYTLSEKVDTEYYEALLACGEAFEQAGKVADASRLFLELLGAEHPEFVRMAALRGLVSTQGEEAVPQLFDALSQGESIWVAAACQHLRTVGGTKTTLATAALLPELPLSTQVMVIEALGDRGDPAALDTLLALSSQPNPAIRNAVATALGSLGNETHVALLLDLMAGDDTELAARARRSLLHLADVGVNGALLRELGATAAEFQPPIMMILAERRATRAVPVLLNYALHEEGPVQQAAFRALGPLVSSADIAQLYGAYQRTQDEATRTIAGEALLAAFRRVPADDERTELLNTLYESTTAKAVKGGLLQVFRQLGDDALLPMVRTSLASTDSLEHQFAREVLLAWPGAAALHDAYTLAEQTDDTTARRIALKAHLRMLDASTTLDDASKLAYYQKTCKLTSDLETLRLLLSGVGKLRSEQALNFAEDFLLNEGLHSEAAIAAEQIRRKFYTALASVNTDTASHSIDGDDRSFWDSGTHQAPGQWVEIDLFRPAAVRGLVIDFARTPERLPRNYAIYVGSQSPTLSADTDTQTPNEEVPVATGKATTLRSVIDFPPVEAQWIRIVQMGSDDKTPWEIREIQVVPN